MTRTHADRAERSSLATPLESGADVQRQTQLRPRRVPPRFRASLRAHWLPLLLLALIIAAGSWMRFTHLGATQFSMDEATHYYAAVSLGEGRGPLLPSGRPYGRGVDLERVTAVLHRFVQQPELALRLPGAAFGAFNLLLFAAVSWAIAGAWPTVWAVLLLAIYPEAIMQARDGRFYTYQLCFVLLALLAAWRTLQACSAPAALRAWLWAGATGAFFLLGARVQVVTLSVAVGCGVAFLGAALGAALRGARGWRANPALQLCAVGFAVAAVSVAALPDLRDMVVVRAVTVPLWAGNRPGDPRAYHWALVDAIPLFYSLAPLSFAVAFVRDWRSGVLLASWFVVPFLLHSFAFAWKGERFLIGAMPALFLATGIGAAMLATAVRRAAAQRLAWLGPSLARAAAAGLVGAVSLFALVSTPAFNTARKIPAPTEDLDWRAAAAQIERTAGGRRLPLGSSMPLPALFYFGRLDFTVGTDYLEDGLEGRVVRRPEGAPDYYSGTPVLIEPERIRETFREQGAVFIAIDPDRLEYGNIHPALPPVLTAEAREICQGHCRGLLLYYWPLR
jgi:hypothetical protein